MHRAPLATLLFVCTAAAQDWPSFRGPGASGVADGQKLPAAWDISKGTNIAWKTPIPGLAHSSPIVWGDRVFVTTAVSSRPDASFKRGLYGEGDASDDRSVQQWKLLCLNRKTGAIVWERVAYQGVPKEKRHMKATYANATPVTDGRWWRPSSARRACTPSISTASRFGRGISAGSMWAH